MYCEGAPPSFYVIVHSLPRKTVILSEFQAIINYAVGNEWIPHFAWGQDK